jgi:hypothetical protein
MTDKPDLKAIVQECVFENARLRLSIGSFGYCALGQRDVPCKYFDKTYKLIGQSLTVYACQYDKK